MGFDFVSQLQGPQIDIGMYGDAAYNGALVGKMTPTPFAAAAEGLMQGITTGANLYNQAQDNVRADQQVEIQRKNAETAAKNQEADAAYQKERLKIDAANLEIQRQQEARLAAFQQAQMETEKVQKSIAEQKLKDATAQKLASAAIMDGLNKGTMTPEDVLGNKEYSDILTNGSKESDSLLGYMASKATRPETKDAIAKIIDFKGINDLEMRLKESEAAKKDKRIEDYQKAKEAFINDPSVHRDIKTLPDSAFWGSDIEVYKSYEDPHTPEGKKPKASGMFGAWKATDENAFNIYHLGNKVASGSKEAADAVAKMQTSAGLMRGTTYDMLQQERQTKSAAVKGTPTTASSGTPAYDIRQSTQNMVKQGFDPSQMQQYSQQYVQAEAGKLSNQSSVGKAISWMAKRLDPDVNPYTASSVLGNAAYRAIEGIASMGKDPVADARNLMAADFANRRVAQVKEMLQSGDDIDARKLKVFTEETGIDPRNEEDLREYYTTFAQGKLSNYDKEVTGALEAEDNATINLIAKRKSDVAKDPVLASTNRKAADALVEKARSTPPADKPSEPSQSTPDATPTPKAQNKAVERVTTDPAFAGSSTDVKALATVENAGRVGTAEISPTKVIGPLQVTGDTARKYAVKYNLSNSKPEDQIKIAEYHFNELTSNYTKRLIDINGTQPSALDVKLLAYAAYNAGEPTINDAIKLAGSTKWQDLKPYLKAALRNNPKVWAKTSLEYKYRELVDYPEKVLRGYNAILAA